MRRALRIYQAILGLFVLLIVLGIAVKEPAFAVLGVLLIIPWVFVGGFIARMIGSMFISSVKCKGCGFEIPAVAQWQIGSYTDHKERHFMWAKNPIDGSRIGHTNCPQCSATVLL